MLKATGSRSQSSHAPSRIPAPLLDPAGRRAWAFWLSEYYSGEGKGDPLVIELPKGGYIPRFRETEAAHSGRKAGPRRLWLTAGLAALSVSAAPGWWWAQHNGKPVAIAVLPFENLNHNPVDDYFADGLTEEIIRDLSIIDGLAVRSQTSSFAFKGKPGTCARRPSRLRPIASWKARSCRWIPSDKQ